MGSNRFKDTEFGSLMRNKLSVLLGEMVEKFQAGELEHLEGVQDEYIRAIRLISTEPYKPIFQAYHVQPGEYPDLGQYRVNFGDIETDMRLLTTEVKNLQDVMVANFNMASRQESQVLEGIKRTRSLLGDLKLYGTGPETNNLFFSDSFNTLQRSDVESSLLAKPQAAIATEEGIITLPYDQADAVPLQIRRIVINDASNGTLGNRTGGYNPGALGEAGARVNQFGRVATYADTEAALDNNPDTWFEYEAVRTQSDFSFAAVGQIPNDPLTLDMTCILIREAICNRIIINPNHFGLKSWFKIRKIETSRDGHNWRSIFDDIPEAEWTVDDRGEFHTLAPESSKFAGQGVYSFLPRKIKFIHIVIEQPQHYLTSRGNEGNIVLRKAIGIRDVSAFSIKYKAEGQFISRPFISTQDIRKVGLLTNQNPQIDSPLIKIEHAVSIDDGQQWHSVVTFDRFSTETEEILTFNSGEGTIQYRTAAGAAIPIKRLRYRATLSRDKAAFASADKGPNPVFERASEILTVPANAPFRINLENEPSSVVTVVRPFSGTVGTFTEAYNLGTAREPQAGATSVYFYRFDIPRYWDTGTGAYIGAENIKVGGQVWAKDNALTQDALVYRINYNQKQVTFGAGGAVGAGRAPEAGAVISMYLDPEPMVIEKDSPHRAELINYHDGIKGSVRIRKYSVTINNSQEGREVVGPGQISHQVKPGRWTQTVEVDVIGGGPMTPVADVPPGYGFVDGETEFTVADKYSVDQENGIVYFSEPASADNATARVITYTYKLYEDLSPDLFTLSGPREVTIDGAGLEEHNGTMTIGDNLNVINLFATLRTDGADGAGGEWANGETNYPQLPVGHGAIIPGTLRIPRGADGNPPRNGGVDIFREEVEFINGSAEFDTREDVAYRNGLYSIDHRNGLLYTYTNTGALAWNAIRTLRFRYADYRIEYGMGEPLKYTVRDNVLTLNESDVVETYKDSLVNERSDKSVKVEYNFVADTIEALKELEPYFSPILRDYSLVAIPVDPRLGTYE